MKPTIVGIILWLITLSMVAYGLCARVNQLESAWKVELVEHRQDVQQRVIELLQQDAVRKGITFVYVEEEVEK